MQVVGSNWPKPHYTLLITGLCRFKVISVLKERPFVFAEVKGFLCQKSFHMLIEIVVKMSQGLKGAMCEDVLKTTNIECNDHSVGYR